MLLTPMLPLAALALALALDAATVSAAVGAASAPAAHRLRAALVFGLFQAGMSALGALAGTTSQTLLGPILPWAAGAILVALGSFVAFGPGDDDDDTVTVATWPALLTLGVATSIDALAAGVALPLWPIPVAASAATIGIVTVVASLLAGWLGAAASRLHHGERIAGIVLLLLGLRTLWDAWG
jgi:putative Mn2+ efflux pump MntP